MDTFNFATPLEIVKIIPLFIYINSLSDFLLENNYLSKEDLNKEIPVVNGLYEFLETTDNGEKREELVHKLLTDSDLYGDKMNETADIYFVNIMFEHIVTSLVFEKYANVYGFIVHTVLFTENITISYLTEKMEHSLREIKLQNKDGSNFTLSELSIKRIMNDLIMPLFPGSERNWSIESVDFIYAQAGQRYLIASRGKHIFYQNSAENNHNQQQIQNISNKAKIDELVTIGVAIEQLVIADQKLDRFALSFFALPAMILYVHEERERFVNKMTAESIVTNPDEWAKAHNLLFLFLQQEFKTLNYRMTADVRFQFQIALHNFKNYSALTQNMEIDSSKSETNRTLSPTYRNPDFIYDNKCQEVALKYSKLQLSVLGSAFSENFINSINEARVTIHETEIKCNSDTLNCIQIKDVYEFYYPETNVSEYYALISNDEYEVELIKESVNPTLFKQRLGVNKEDLKRKVGPELKNENETFRHFLMKVAEKKSNLFQNILYMIGRPEKKGEWWQQNGPDWTPFYLCLLDIIQEEKNSNFCLMDTILNASVKEDETEIGLKIASKSTLSMLATMGTDIRSFVLRDFIQNILQIEKNPRTEELTKSVEIGTKIVIHDLGHSIYRLLDTRFELFFIIARQGIENINDLMTKIGQKTNSLFEAFKESYREVISVLSVGARKVGNILRYNVYAKSLGSQGDASYGYKFIRLSRFKIARLRSMEEFPEEQVPVVTYRDDNNKEIYKYFNVETEKEEETNMHLRNGNKIKNSEAMEYELKIRGYDPVNACELNMTKSQIVAPCPRARRLTSKRDRIKTALSLLSREDTATITEVRNKLNTYYFPDVGNTEIASVCNWMKYTRPIIHHNRADKLFYEISEHQLFFNLKYNLQLDSRIIKKSEAEARINSLYTFIERREIDHGVSIEVLRGQYFFNRLYESLTFEDFYAIRNYELGGYTRISRNTDEAKMMKIALYKLAIRQCDDPDEEFEPILYRQERRPKQFVDRFSPGAKYIFDQFISVSENFTVGYYPSDHKTVTILYDLKFPERYLRAKFKGFQYNGQDKIVLLQDTEFNVEEVKELFLYEGTKYFKIVLRLNNETHEMIKWQQNVMKEIQTLLMTNTKYNYSNETVEDCRASIKCVSFFDD